MRCSAAKGWEWTFVCLLGMGCNQNPFLTPQATPPAAVPTPQTQPYAAQLQESSRVASTLEANNRDLHTALARAEQQNQLLEEEVALLRKRVTETANQLRETQVANQAAEQKIQAIQASTRSRGGATITANNSRLEPLRVADIPGFDVRQDGDVIRVEVPVDRLFHSRSSQLLPSATTVLDQLADSIIRTYPRQMIAVEAHTDNAPAGTVSNHELSAQQGAAVCSALSERNRIPSDQLFIVAHGGNHPRVSNATPSGRSKNRRVELVIYPETVNRS